MCSLIPALNALSKSLGLRTSMECSFIPRTCAAPWTSFNSTSLEASPGSRSTAMRDAFGNVSLSSSSRLPAKSEEIAVSLVIFPPGRARLAINPLPTGSRTLVITIGIVLVACWAARVTPFPPAATIISTLRRANSAARSGNRSIFPSANRYSMAMF